MHNMRSFGAGCVCGGLEDTIVEVQLFLEVTLGTLATDGVQILQENDNSGCRGALSWS